MLEAEFKKKKKKQDSEGYGKLLMLKELNVTDGRKDNGPKMSALVPKGNLGDILPQGLKKNKREVTEIMPRTLKPEGELFGERK